MPGAAAMACSTLPAAGAVRSVAISATAGAAWAWSGSGSTSSPKPDSTAASNSGNASLAMLGSATNSSTWPRRAPRLNSLLRLLADTADDSWPSTIRTRISPSKRLANWASTFAGRACRPWALAKVMRALGQSAGSSPPNTSSTARRLVARPSSWPRPSISNAHKRSSKA